MATFLCAIARIHTVRVLARLSCLVSCPAVVLLVGAIGLVRVTIDLAGSVLVPAEQALLLVFLTRLNPLNMLTLAVDDILTARLDRAQISRLVGISD